jgi:hypothetical protein
LEADLARQGISLPGLVTEAGGLPWRRLRTLIYNLPPGSALHRSMDLPIQWGNEAHMLALIADQLAIANWQRTADGQKGRKRPKPLRRPGVAEAGVTKYGTKQSNPAAARAYLRSVGPKREEVSTSWPKSPSRMSPSSPPHAVSGRTPSEHCGLTSLGPGCRSVASSVSRSVGRHPLA